MATAETMTFTDNIKTLGDSIVKLTVLEAKSLGDYLETVHGIKAAAAAVVAGPPRARRRRRARRGQTSSTSCSRPSAPTRSTSSRSSGPPPASA
jgi:large subunit ribosomal protein L7/L12